MPRIIRPDLQRLIGKLARPKPAPPAKPAGPAGWIRARLEGLDRKPADGFSRPIQPAKPLPPPAKGHGITSDTFNDFLDGMKVKSEVKYTRPGGIDPTLAKQIITACHESHYDEVKTLKDAFAAVDHSEIVVRRLQDPATGRRYVSVDFGAGENTYGAIFLEGKTRAAAAIHDGDLAIR
jgi:hypothetical protein